MPPFAASFPTSLMLEKHKDLYYFDPLPVAIVRLPSVPLGASNALCLRRASVLREISAVHGPLVKNLCGEKLFFFGMLYFSRLFLVFLGVVWAFLPTKCQDL